MHINIHVILSHKNWRKLIKKTRRKILRKKNAQERDENFEREYQIRNSDPAYVAQKLEEEEITEEIERRDELDALRRREEWRKKDLVLHSQWLLNQERKTKLDVEKKFQEESIRKEWEEKVAKESDAAKKIKDAENELLKEATRQLGTIEASCNPDPPPGYVRPQISKAEPCPFFTKTGACRFGFNCSRDHDYPQKSQTILLPNMYTHFGLHGALTDDYDTDISLEYSESDTQHHFRDFFYDVLPEFEKCGRVIQLKVCSNKSAHLKGNVYVQFEKVESAEIAYGMFNGRWYAGRQVSCVFVNIEHWKPAICGLYFTNKCPKGDSCNFLHVYKNPGNAFYAADRDWFHDKQYEGTPRSESHRWQSGSYSSERTGRRTKSYSRNIRRLPEGERRRYRRSFSRENKKPKKDKTKNRKSRSRSKKNRKSRSRSKENRKSRSRSKEIRKSRSRSNENRKSRSRSKENRKSRSWSKENRISRSRSKENKKSRSRSKENRKSRSRSKENRKSRSRSKEDKKSRSRSKEYRKSRSRSKENRKSRSRSKETRNSRRDSHDKKKGKGQRSRPEERKKEMR